MFLLSVTITVTEKISNLNHTDQGFQFQQLEHEQDRQTNRRTHRLTHRQRPMRLYAVQQSHSRVEISEMVPRVTANFSQKTILMLALATPVSPAIADT